MSGQPRSYAKVLFILLTMASCQRPDAAAESGTSGRPELVSLLGKPLYARPVGADPARLHADFEAARAAYQSDPADVDKLIWYGRRLGYLWRYNEAVDVFTRGIGSHPDEPRLYRHRGHRYVTLRRFEKAVEDLERAATLIAGRPDEVEPDGAPNPKNIPLTTTAFNVWYHLGVARYLKADFAGALQDFERAAEFGRGYDDNLVATSDWRYMCLRRLGRAEEAAALLAPIRPDMDIIENHAYFRRMLFYKGLIGEKELLDTSTATDLDVATQGYGLGNWRLYNGDRRGAGEMFRRVVAGPYWPAFGYIAAEVELARGAVE